MLQNIVKYKLVTVLSLICEEVKTVVYLGGYNILCMTFSPLTFCLFLTAKGKADFMKDFGSQSIL